MLYREVKVKNKKIIITIISILVIIILGIAIYKIIDSNNQNKEVLEDSEEGMIGGIENEEYYYEKQEEFRKLEEQEENLIQRYIDSEFSENEKSELQDYQKRMTEAVQNGNKDEKRKISDQYIARIEELLELRCSAEQKNELKEIREKEKELESIVEEYDNLKLAEYARRDKEGIEVLEDGRKSNKREDVISDKETNGLKFSNISLIYDTQKKETIFKSTVTNTTQENKDNQQEVTLKFTGDVETEFQILIEPLLSNESMDVEIPISADITMASKLEIF